MDSRSYTFTPVPDAVAKLRLIRGYIAKYNIPDYPAYPGFSTQEVQAALPEFVYETSWNVLDGEDKALEHQPDSISVIQQEVILELLDRVEALEARLGSVEETLESLEVVDGEGSNEEQAS